MYAIRSYYEVHQTEHQAQTDKRTGGFHCERKGFIGRSEYRVTQNGSISQDFTDSAQHSQCQSITQTNSQTVCRGSQNAVFGGKCLGAAQNDTVYNDQRNKVV